MAGIAHVLVVLPRAGEREGVVAPDRVAHDLDQRVHVDVVELPLEPGQRVGLTHQRAGGRRIEAALDAVLELGPVEREEVGALLALDVDDLDELAGSHLVRERRCHVDSKVEPRLRERRGKLVLLVAARLGAAHLDEQLGGWGRAVHDPPSGRGHDDRHRALGTERLRRAGRRPVAEEPDRGRLVGVEPARAELAPEQAAVAIGQCLAHDRRRRVRGRAERRRVVASVHAEHAHLRDLPAVLVDDRHPLVGRQSEHRRPTRADEVRLEERILGEQPAD